MSEKAKIFEWMTKKKYRNVNSVGAIVSHYYMDPEDVIAAARKNANWVFGV